jgi:CRP-like cAMP-binding protein
MTNKRGLKLSNSEIILDFFEYLKPIADFNEWEMNLLREIIQIRKVKKGTTLLVLGEIPQNLYFVNKGCLRTFYLTDNGSVFIRCLAFEKSFCWSIPGFLNQQPSNEIIDALCDSELIVINKNSFDELNVKSESFRNAYQKVLEQLCMHYASRIESFLTMDAKLRYENFLAKKPSIVQKLPNKILAAYLGITQESLSRIKKIL